MEVSNRKNQRSGKILISYLFINLPNRCRLDRQDFA